MHHKTHTRAINILLTKLQNLHSFYRNPVSEFHYLYTFCVVFVFAYVVFIMFLCCFVWAWCMLYEEYSIYVVFCVRFPKSSQNLHKNCIQMYVLCSFCTDFQKSLQKLYKYCITCASHINVLCWFCVCCVLMALILYMFFGGYCLNSHRRHMWLTTNTKHTQNIHEFCKCIHASY